MVASTVLFFIALACMLAVVGSFFWGMVAMTGGSDKDRIASNKMMRFRVGFQGLALLFLLLSYLAK